MTREEIENIPKEVIKCLKCKYYIDKDYIFKDHTNNIEINFGKLKDCKFHTDKSWECNFEEVSE